MKVSFNKTPKTYYISSTGNNSNDGLTLATPWATTTYAASISSPVLPGDKVYIKSGTYSNENVVMQKNGLPGAPIEFIGYKTTPGDSPALIVNSGTPYAAYSNSEMPTFTGSSRVTGTAFDLRNSQYITLKNIQVQTYYRAFILGFSSPANYNRLSGNIFYNCNCMSLGDLTDSYSGFGFSAGLVIDTLTNHVRANGNLFEVCQITNPGAEGMGIYGDYNTLVGCKVFCNESTNVLDYFINVCGSYNALYGCDVEGTTGNFGGTHGIGFKSNAEQVVDLGRAIPVVNPEYNRVFNCTSRNIGEGLYVRHRGSKYNYFSQCSSFGTHAGTDASSGAGGGVIIRDGASYNTFDRCYGEGLQSAILFQDTTEDGDAGNTPGHTGNYNIVTNCVFYNCYFGMHYDDYDTPSDCGINTIANNTFYRCRYLYGAYRSCTQMIYQNNIYYGNGSLGFGGTFVTDGGTGFAVGVTAGQFTNCNFFDIAGGMPGGFVAATTAGTTTDPLFTSLGVLGGAAPNLRLQASSPARDSGLTIPYIKNDYDGIGRPFATSYSKGAFDR